MSNLIVSREASTSHALTPTRPKANHENKARPKRISLVIPTRNESGNIKRLLQEITAEFARFDTEIIFVDDSEDDTVDTIKRIRQTLDTTIRIIHRPPSKRDGGLGTAVLEGFKAASGPWALVMDADLQHPPTAAGNVARSAVAGDADVVIGSRYTKEGTCEGLSASRRFMSSTARQMAKALFPRRLGNVSDPLSGMFAVRLDSIDLKDLKPSGFKILVELLLSQPPLRVEDVGYQFNERTNGESKASTGEMKTYLSLLLRRRVQGSFQSARARSNKIDAAVNS